MSNVVINPYSFAGETRLITRWTLADASDLDLELWGSNLGTSTYNFDVDWGDGSTETGITTSDKSHTYASTGTYTVKIGGQFAGFYMDRGSTADKAKFVEFVQWGSETEIHSLYRAFYQCTNMVYSATDAPDLSNLSGSTQMRQTFLYCYAVQYLDLSGWTNTDNITSGYGAFYACTGLLTLNLTGWDTSNFTAINEMCRATGHSTNGCTFTMPNLDLTSCTTPQSIFQTATIKSVNIDNWTLKPSTTLNFNSFFYDADGDSEGTNWTIDLSGWTNEASINTLNGAFRSCDGLTSVDLTNFDNSNVATWYYGFGTAPDLTQIVGLNAISAASFTGTAMYQVFYGCSNLDFATHNFGTAFGPNLGSVTNFSSCFRNCGSATGGITAPEVGNWDVSSATTFANMFQGCKISGTLDVSSWDVSSVVGAGFGSMFYNSSVSTVDTSNWQISSGATYFYGCCRGATNLTTIDFSHASADLSGVTSWSYFCYYGGLTRFILNVSSSFAAVTAMTNMFGGMTILTADYDLLLIRCEATNSNTVTLGAGNSKYTGGGAAATARAALIADHGWTITDGGIA